MTWETNCAGKTDHGSSRNSPSSLRASRPGSSFPLLSLFASALVVAAVTCAPPAAAAPTEFQHVMTPYPGGKWSPPPAQYGIGTKKDLLVTMSDGAQIPVDLYFPTDLVTGVRAKGPFPVLLTRFWYTSAIRDRQPAMTGFFDNPSNKPDFFVARGYIYVSADVRGTGRSLDAGSYLGERDAQDGVDLTRWTLTIPGSSGVVGFIGCSGMGLSQLDTATLLGPKSPVKAMIPACVPGDQYRDTYTQNGVFRPTWRGLAIAGLGLLGPGVVPEFSRIYAESMLGGDAAFDGQWWGQRNFVSLARQIAGTGAAILLWNGWNDTGFGGLELFAALQNAAAGRGPETPLWPGLTVSGRYQLTLGDWDHAAGLDPGIQLQWFETWLRGVDTGLPTNTRTPLHVQDRVTKEWFNLASYPMTDHYTRLYFGSKGLTREAAPASQTRLAWDGEDGNSLEYTSGAFQERAQIAGPVAVRLNASSSNTDALFRVELFDVAADGSSRLISHGMILGSMRALDPKRSWRDRVGNPVRPLSHLQFEAPITPDQPFQYELQLEPTLWTIRPAHRLRVRVSARPAAKDCPLFAGNIGCIFRQPVYDRLLGGVYTLFLGGEDGSIINLPLMPANRLRPIRHGMPPTASDDLPLDW